MIFGKKTKGQVVEDLSQETSQPPKKNGFVSRAVQGAKNKAIQAKQKAQERAEKARKVKLVLTVATTLFFIGNSLYWVFNRWGDFGNLLWVMLAVTVAYILVFIVTLAVHSKNAKQMSMDNKKFKVQLKLWRTLANVLFIAMSGLSLAQNLMAWRADGGATLLVSMLVSGLVLFVKLISALFRMVKLNNKRKKLNKRQQKLNAKQQCLQQGEKH